jgi:hypothetical protein
MAMIRPMREYQAAKPHSFDNALRTTRSTFERWIGFPEDDGETSPQALELLVRPSAPALHPPSRHSKRLACRSSHHVPSQRKTI